MSLYKFVYQTFFYRHPMYVSTVLILALAWERFFENAAESFFNSVNAGATQWEMRRKISAEKAEAGEPCTWKKTQFLSSRPTDGNNDVGMGNPRFPEW